MGLSCSMWDLVSRPGIEPGPPALGMWSFSYWITREVPRTQTLKPYVMLSISWLIVNAPTQSFSSTGYISYSSSELQLTLYFLLLFSKDSSLVSISW